ncbi:MAG: response regulator [Verrucomicrobiota bacterium JB023]|nr:response regulator [Verrucomicrobiota bacterium JB023]
MEVDESNLAEILLVDDNEDDVFITRKGFENARFRVNLNHVENGKDCLAYLRKEGEFSKAKTPDLILLDLNMPVMDGREVLAEISQDENLKHLPVVILTTSANEEDVLKMYSLRCSAYVTKPVSFAKFREVIEVLGNYWFTVVKLPPK